MANWRDYYKIQADNADISVAEHNRLRKARLERDNSSDLASAAFTQKNAIDYNTVGTNDGGKKDENWLGNLTETPIIKSFLDVLSTGTYAIGNSVSNALDINERRAKGELTDEDVLRMSTPLGGIEALGQGIAGALGNKDFQKTQGPNIKRAQENAGIDPESEESKAVQGWGGFAGDVLLDPTSYLSLGTGAAIKGAIKGARVGRNAAKEAAKDAVTQGVKSPELERIANNSKGILGTAAEYSKEYYNKADKGLIFGRGNGVNKGEGVALSGDEALVGKKFNSEGKAVNEPAALQESIDARRVEQDKANTKLAQVKMEAELARLNQLVPEKVTVNPATKATPQEALNEILDDIVTPKVKDIIPDAKAANSKNAAKKAVPDIDHQVGIDNSIRALEDKWFTTPKVADDIPAAKVVIPDAQKKNQLWNVIWDFAKKNPEKEFPTTRGMVKGRDLLQGLRAPSELMQRQLGSQVLEWARGRLRADSVAARGTSATVAQVPKRMTDTQIKKSFLNINSGMPKGLRDQIKNITGIADNDEAAIAKFLEMRKDLAARDKSAKSTVKEAEKRQVELATTTKPVETKPQDIENTALNNEELVAKIMSDPDAIKAAVGAEARAQSFFDELTTIPTRSSYSQFGGYTKDVINDTAHTAVKKAIDVQKKEARLQTNKGFRTNSQGVSEGNAWKVDRWSSNSQQALMRHILTEVNKAIPGRMRYGIRLAAFMETMRVANKELMAIGIEPFMDFATTFGKQSHLNLSAFDVFNAIEKSGFKNNLGRMLFGGKAQAFQPTQITGAVEAMMRGRAAGKSEYEIQKAVKRYLVGNATEHGFPFRNAEAGQKFVGKFADNREVRAARLKFTDTVAKTIMDPRVYDNLQHQSVINNLAHASKVADKVEVISKETLANMYKLADMSDPANAAAYMLSESRKLTSKFSPDDLETARTLFQKEMNDIVTPAEKSVAVSSAKRVATESQKEINKTHVSDAGKAIEETKANMPESAEEFDYVSGAIAAAAWKKIHPVASLLNPRLGLSDSVYRLVNTGMHSIGRQQNEFHASIVKYLAQKGDAALLNSFNEIRDYADTYLRTQGKKAKVNTADPFIIPETASQDAKELYSLITHIMDVSGNNIWSRNGIGAAHFNSLADAAGLNKAWRFDPELDKYTNSHKWVSEWKGIQEKGVMDFLSRVHSVALKASQEIALAADFSFRFGVAKPQPGYVKLVWNARQASEGSAFINLIDDGLYYPREIAAQVHRVNEILNESRHINNKFIREVYDPITNALKASMTTVRPGHWVVSVSGDILRNHIAGVSSLRPYKDSLKILTAGKKVMNDYDRITGDLSYFEPLKHYRTTQEIAQGFVGTSTGEGRNFYINGKKVKVDFETLNKMMRDAIMIPPHHGGGVLEDRLIGENLTSKFAQKVTDATNFVTDNPKFNLNSMAAGRDNFMRVALAVDYASKRKWKNLEEMKSGMEDYVTKWAPTSTDFTAFEAKYPRRVFYFYTWLRGITPRIIDASMSRPGVATVLPKAMYNMAYANGVNPESIGNPFPDEKLFPDYYRDGVLGPQWKDGGHYWGVNPSAPIFDVLNTFKGIKPGDPAGSAMDTGQTLLGMTNPLLRAPVELAQQKTTSGIDIQDPYQYLGDTFGGSYLSTLSRGTGKTIGPDGILTRTDAMKRTPEQQQEEAKRQFINFLTGIKATDYTSDGAQRSAAYTERQKYKDQANAERRKE